MPKSERLKECTPERNLGTTIWEKALGFISNLSQHFVSEGKHIRCILYGKSLKSSWEINKNNK